MSGEIPGSALIVCTGNLCRSPMGEVILRHLLLKNGYSDVAVSSAGTAGIPLAAASSHAREAVEEIGLSLHNFHSRQLTQEMIDRNALVLVMEERHRRHIAENFTGGRKKTFLLPEYAAGLKGIEVRDPMGYELDAYKNCRDEILGYMEKIIEKWG